MNKPHTLVVWKFLSNNVDYEYRVADICKETGLTPISVNDALRMLKMYHVVFENNTEKTKWYSAMSTFNAEEFPDARRTVLEEKAWERIEKTYRILPEKFQVGTFVKTHMRLHKTCKITGYNQVVKLRNLNIIRKINHFSCEKIIKENLYEYAKQYQSDKYDLYNNSK